MCYTIKDKRRVLFMNKKFLFSFLLLPFLVGCNNTEQKENKALIYRINNYNEQIELNVSDLSEKLGSNSSFILQTYSDPNCICTGTFSNLLKKIMNEKNIMIYKTSTETYKKTKKDVLNSNDTFSYDTGLIIVNKGQEKKINASEKWKKQINGLNGDYQSILKDIEEYAYLDSPFYSISSSNGDFIEENSIDTLYDKINRHETFKIYYYNSGCSDCMQFNERFLNKWALDVNNQNHKIYVIDLKKYASRDDYQNIKDELGLSSKNNTIGYKNGVVPTLQSIVNGEIYKMAVFYNDIMQTNEETNQITVLEGYYNAFNNLAFDSYPAYYDYVTEFYMNKFLDIINS